MVLYGPNRRLRWATAAGLGADLLVGFAALFQGEVALADADGLGGHLDELVLDDPLDRGLQRVDPRCWQFDGVVVAVRTDVVLLLRTHGVDDHLVVSGALADDHALVDLFAGGDEELPAELQLVERVPGGLADAVGNHRPTACIRHVPGPRHPAHVVLVQQRGAAGGGHQQRTEPDESAAGALEGDDGAAGVAGSQIGDATFSRGQFLGDRADVFVGHVADATLLRLVPLAVDLFGDDLGPADLELVALAAHRLDQHRELQFAATGDLDDVGRSGLEQLDRDVAEQLFVEPLDEVAAGDVLAVTAGERRGVDAERHA